MSTQASVEQQPRITPLSPPYDLATADLLRQMMGSDREPLKLFRTLARNPQVLRALAANGALVYGSRRIAPLHRELVIQRSCARCGAEYEWGVHAVLFGKRVGLTGERLRATAHGDHRSECWASEEALLIEFVDELHERAAVPDDLWQRMSRHWDHEQMLELAMLAGLYHAISFMINVARVERETFGATFEDVR